MRDGLHAKNAYHANRNGNDLLYVLKLNKHFIKKKHSWFLFKTSVFNSTIYLLCFKRDESKYPKTRNSMFQRKTKHDIEREKRTIKVMQQLHLYIRFHSAPTNQRRIITCSLSKRVISHTVIQCKWCLMSNPPHIYFNEWSFNNELLLFIRRMRLSWKPYIRLSSCKRFNMKHCGLVRINVHVCDLPIRFHHST